MSRFRLVSHWFSSGVWLILLALGWALTGGSSIHSCHEQSTSELSSAVFVGDGLNQAFDHLDHEASCPACTMLRQLFGSSAAIEVVVSHVLSDGPLVVTPASTSRQILDTNATERGPPTI
ncbi:MAG: hypothetical protein DRJ65_20290 [Acidobacteria bacterium]|nr:MAG: hypothetical protein DRJ65_20290 [Acidobacteriota bacterium]